VARETHPPPSSGLPGRLHGLGRRRAIAFRGDPRIGAADAAPTAPHATAPEAPDRRSGPARFWGTRRIRIALVIACSLSLVAHWFVAPWRLLPDTSGLELKDPEGELTIPVELLGEEAPPEEPPQPPERAAPPPEDDPNGAKAKKDAGAPKPKPDAAVPDAEAAAMLDAGVMPVEQDGGPTTNEADGGAPTDAGESDAAGEGGLVASASDASAPPGASGPRDPGAMIGMPGLISAGTVNVTLLVNMSVIRQNPVGKRMGPLLQGIPQWADFMRGSQVAVDPIRDTDWILIYGPSLIHTDRDAVFVHYSIPDAVVDTAVESIAKRYDKGGAYDAGVPGVKASLGHADNAERVFLRGQPHVLVIVPKDKATDFAKLSKRATISPRVRPGEALRLTVKDPWKQVSIPGLKFSNSLKELRLWIVPRAADGGADVFVEGDCTDEAAAADVADALTDLVKRQNAFGVKIVTRGLLNNARFTAEGTHVKSHVSASQEQLEALLQLISAALGVQVQPAGGGP
jgi:hypothetical protein